MSEGNGPTAAPGAETQTGQPMKLQILAQFIRDMSFENVLVQRGSTGEVTPEVQVQVSLDAKKRPTENQYELVMKFKVEAKNKAETLFLLELEYGGVFLIEGVPEAQMHPLLLIECPRLLFPFVRRIVNDVTRDGGFPPVNLEVIDFMAIYRNELARRQSAGGAGDTKPA